MMNLRTTHVYAVLVDGHLMWYHEDIFKTRREARAHAKRLNREYNSLYTRRREAAELHYPKGALPPKTPITVAKLVVTRS